MALALLMGVPAAWSLLAGPAEPLQVVGSEVAWAPDGRALLVRSGERIASTSCPTALLSRWLELTNGSPVYVSAEPMSGPLAGRGTLPPRREAAIDGPSRLPPSQLRITLPDWVQPQQVLSLAVHLSVPTNRPCANGFAGSYDLYRLAVPQL